MVQSLSLLPLLGIFAVAAVVIWIAGVQLSNTTDVLSQRFGLGQALGGVILLAAATSLPELSTGLTSARAGDYQLAISDIFGGNAFLPVLFLLATLISDKAVLPQAHCL